MGLPAKRRRVDQLSPNEKAKLAHDAFYGWATKGKSYKKLGEELDLATSAVKKLIQEYSAFVRENKPDTKAANEEAYRYILSKAVEIIDNEDHEKIPVLVKAKAFEAAIQSLTRLDKLGGHEAPTTNINVDGQTFKDIITQHFAPGGDGENVSPMDTAAIQDDVIEGEVVDEDDNGEDDEIIY